MRIILHLTVILCLLILLQKCDFLLTQPLTFKKLLCEYADEPIGLDVTNPRFSWVIEATQRGQKQVAYRIKVASSKTRLESETPDLWDSAKITSSQTIHQQYQGKSLKSNQTYYWKVSLWDNIGNMLSSKTAKFSTAFLNQEDWSAKWIGTGPVKEPRHKAGFFKSPKEQDTQQDTVDHQGRSVLLRKTINCTQNIKSAKLFVTGLGYYEISINGEKVGDHVLAPAKTPYHKQVLYDTYDVTGYLKKGKNGIGIHLGNGWFNPYKKWWREYRMQWFGYKRALMQMQVDYQDGTSQIFISDETWKSKPGPVLFNCVYDGEVYDATMDDARWSEKDFDDSSWQPVHCVESPPGRLVAHQMPAIKVIQTIIPVKEYKPAPGMLVYDMGQNFTGWVRIALKGSEGTTLTIRFAEDIHEDGTIDITSNEHAKATAVYMLKGDGIETYEPRFTFFGFKYVELTASPALPAIENIEGCVVYTANDPVGTFVCSNDLINKIHQATLWSQKSNMIGYPLDCPQRDERLGWFGDAQVTAEEALFNFDMARFYNNWLSGIKENQDMKSGDIPIISPRPYIQDEGVEWSSTYIILAWHYYRYYGDEQILIEHYDTMKRYMDFLKNLANQYILPQGWIGDWGSLVEGWKEGEPESVPTAFYYFNNLIMAKIAHVINKNEEAISFSKLAEKIKKAYNDNYFNPATKNYNDGSQMANAFALYLNIVPEEYRKDVLENLVKDIMVTHDGHLTTGVLGSKYMIDALTWAGRTDIAWTLATQTGYPSWSDMVEKYTTMCEFWTLKQSHNHVMTGSIDAWFYKALAGIQIDEKHPAFEKIIIRPFLARDLTFTRASIETIKGTVTSGWERNVSGFNLDIRIPFNTRADVYIPAGEDARITENGKSARQVEGIQFLGYKNNYHVYSVESGNYSFNVLL
jgi:alpha-L-rhamnosidase